MEETKELFESNTVFDDVFRTMLEQIPEIMIPLIFVLDWNELSVKKRD